MREWLPGDHLALFESDVVDRLDFGEIEDDYLHLKGGRLGFHPSIMVKLLVYAYCVGVTVLVRLRRRSM